MIIKWKSPFLLRREGKRNRNLCSVQIKRHHRSPAPRGHFLSCQHLQENWPLMLCRGGVQVPRETTFKRNFWEVAMTNRNGSQNTARWICIQLPPKQLTSRKASTHREKYNTNSDTQLNTHVLQKTQVCGTEYRIKIWQTSKAKGNGPPERLGFRRGIVLTGTPLDHLPPAATCHLHFHHFVLCYTHWQYIGIHVHRTDIAQEILDLNYRREKAI